MRWFSWARGREGGLVGDVRWGWLRGTCNCAVSVGGARQGEGGERGDKKRDQKGGEKSED
jgi:hypothetical protein